MDNKIQIEINQHTIVENQKKIIRWVVIAGAVNLIATITNILL